MDFLISLFLLTVYVLLIGFIIIYISSFAGTVFMLLVPLIGVLIMPEEMTGFLSYELFAIMDGAISMRNIHILIALWAAFLSVVIYTEFLGWYMARLPAHGFKSSDIEFPEDENFDARIEVNEDLLEVGKPLICKIFIRSELFKAVLVRIEVRIDGVIVDTIDDLWIKCDIEQEIGLTEPDVTGAGELRLFTSPPGFDSGSVSEATFLVRAKEEEGEEADARLDLTQSIHSDTGMMASRR